MAAWNRWVVTVQAEGRGRLFPVGQVVAAMWLGDDSSDCQESRPPKVRVAGVVLAGWPELIERRVTEVVLACEQ